MLRLFWCRILLPGANFTIDFVVIIPIRRKGHSTLIHLSCSEVITMKFGIRYDSCACLIPFNGVTLKKNLNYDGKKCSWHGPQVAWWWQRLHLTTGNGCPSGRHDDVTKWKHFPRYWPICGEFPSQRPVTRAFDVFIDPLLNKRLSKQSWGWWFETPSCSLWRHCNGRSKSMETGDASFRQLRLLSLVQERFIGCTKVFFPQKSYACEVTLCEVTLKDNCWND